MGPVLGVFWVCFFCFIFKKKILGVFWACFGRVVFASILKKNGACSGRVLGLFSRVANVVADHDDLLTH